VLSRRMVEETLRQCVELFRKERSGPPEVPRNASATRGGCVGQILSSLNPASAGQATLERTGDAHPAKASFFRHCPGRLRLG
jgi:hypothetical protein